MVQKSALILIHGRNGSPADFSSFQMLLRQDMELFPVRYITPDAPPYPFEDSGEQDKNAESLFKRGIKEIQYEINQQLERGIPLERIGLVGVDAGANFILGVAAATAAGVGLEKNPGVYFVSGGYLPDAIKNVVAEGDKKASSPSLIFQYHGSDDKTVPIAKAQETAAWFEERGFSGYKFKEIEKERHNTGPATWKSIIEEIPGLFGQAPAAA